MNYPILIVPVETGGFRTSLGSPFNVTVEASTPGEVETKAFEAIVDRLRNGGELRWLTVPPVLLRPPMPRVPIDDELDRMHREAIEEHRRETDAAELRRIDEEDAEKARTAS